MATAEELYGTDINHKSDYVRDSNGSLGTISGLDNYVNWVFRCIMTTPGTIVHRPNFGVGIKLYQNAIHNLDQRRSLSQKIADNLELDDRTQEVLGVRIEYTDDTPDSVKVTVRVKPVGLDEVTMQITPFGGEIV